MNLEAGQTIFDKIEIPYDTLRNFANPIKPITEYYRQLLKPGEEVWWLDQDDTQSKSLIIKLWNNLPNKTKRYYMQKSMVLFPEIFSNRPDKFNRLAVWLVNSEGVVCPNIRDVFTAGGQGYIKWNNNQYHGIPQIFMKLSKSIDDLKKILIETDNETLEKYWGTNIYNNRIDDWIEIVANNSRLNQDFELSAYLKSRMLNTDH